LGGTVFLGRWLVEAASRRGHELTLFNRGQSAPEAFPEVEQLRGDRDGDLSSLQGRAWDAVIDTSGFLPRVVRQSAELLSPAVEQYTFVSSISAYGEDLPDRGLTEEAPVAALPDPESEDVERYYGELKAACEGEVKAVFGERSLIVRPGLIVGPNDPTERFTYWVRRLADGGTVLAPRATDQPVQLIDVRDLADWTIAMVERRARGTYNATGPAERLTFSRMLERMSAVIGGAADLRLIDEDVLAGAGVEPWTDLPLWLDLSRHPELAGFLAVDVSRALASGLTLRPVEETALDTLNWTSQNGTPQIEPSGEPVPLPGLTRSREQELLSLPRA
jgi:2'-hydroxyisoflavone reductase